MNTHIACLKKACDRLGYSYRQVGKTGVFIEVDHPREKLLFIANEMPFNNHIVHRITEDKSFTSELLGDVVAMPRTRSFLDPDCRELFRPFRGYTSRTDIVDAIEQDFSYPFILKKNSGSQGTNVFKCTNRGEIERAMAAIFDQTSLDYDHVMLAQERVSIAHEYRVTVFDQEILLVYEKDFSQAKFVGNLSPFHWEGSRATIVSDSSLLGQLRSFIAPIYEKLPLCYGGLDIAIDTTGKMWLFEINSKPAYNYLVQDNGEEVLVALYAHMLVHTDVLQRRPPPNK